MDKFEAIDILNTALNKIENDIQKTFYYLEEEHLLQKPSSDKWNIIEIFAHLSYTHAFYLGYLKKRLTSAEENVSPQPIKRSWIGRMMENGLKPTKDNQIRFKSKTFKKIDPLVKQKEGVKIQANVVFKDFNDDLTTLREIIELMKTRDISNIKTATLLPYIKVNISDALFYLIAHLERHILQAKALLK